MTEEKLISKVDIECEELLYRLTKIDSLTENAKLVMLNKLKEVQMEIKYKKYNWEDN